MAQTSQAVAQLASNLDTLGSADLKQLRLLVDQSIRTAEAREMQAARDQIQAIAKSVGMSPAEILGHKAPTVTRDVKYRNPENSSETWTGRGARPKWVGAALASGKTLDQLKAQ